MNLYGISLMPLPDSIIDKKRCPSMDECHDNKIL